MSLEHDIKTMVESLGLSLYDTAITSENGETIYRVSVNASGGVSMDQVVEATRLISPLLDVTPPVSGEYRLEVGSPGIERKLSKLSHFENSLGENRITSYNVCYTKLLRIEDLFAQIAKERSSGESSDES